DPSMQCLASPEPSLVCPEPRQAHSPTARCTPNPADLQSSPRHAPYFWRRVHKSSFAAHHPTRRAAALISTPELRLCQDVVANRILAAPARPTIITIAETHWTAI